MVDLSTRLLRSFLAVAEELNFTRAAHRLHVAQQTLSSQISQLEKALGTPLLERTTRQVTLTAAGETLKVGGMQLLGTFDELVEETRRVSGDPQYSIRLGVVAGAAWGLTSPILHAASDAGIAVEVSEYALADPSCGLEGGDTDVAIFYGPLGIEHDEIVLYSDPMVLAVASTHVWADRDFVSTDEAFDAPLIALPHTDSTRRRFWTLADLRPPDKPAKVAAVARGLEGTLALVAAGIGMMPTTGRARIGAPRPGIAYVPILGAPAVQMVAAARKGDERANVRRFMEIVQQVVDEAGDTAE
ncbi:LysR family transcriptional regulator [Rhodococcus sp. ABRD24]|uniref:LysR family transcriptional regulator n=1 Tax=Rhodococcus sp. ABRD24 TaxID=2507582 RepID=UPI00103907D3|nr:LysR family transcriptional regulator [Rhodococcus sp. ABRD24]QBJ96561.1 LysR family transcriptional regulator [Rhodococcus sp. ABRD24]